MAGFGREDGGYNFFLIDLGRVGIPLSICRGGVSLLVDFWPHCIGDGNGGKCSERYTKNARKDT